MFPQTYTQSADDCWYVVHCKPGKEFLAESLMKESLDLPTYLPTVLSRLRGTAKRVPFFPGYLFVSATPTQPHLSRIRAIPGVLRVLDFGNGPQPVPKPVVKTIMDRLDVLNAGGGLPEHNFKLGDTVWMRSGPFRGLQAVFMGPMTPSARVKVLLQFLGRLNEVKVDIEDLTQTRDDPAPRKHRGTRGSGRTVKSA